MKNVKEDVNEKSDEPTVFTDTWEEVINAFDDENAYGGIYIDGDTLHIKPTDNEQIQTVLQDVEGFDTYSDSENSNIIVDDVAEYSLQELLEAKERVSADHERLGIVTTGISIRNNALRVGALEWSEGKKQEVYEVAAIENIIFDTEREKDPEKEEEPIISNISPRKYLPLYMGGQIRNEDNGYKSTIGVCATVSGKNGFITAGHNNEKGDEFTYDTSHIGYVTKTLNVGSTDAAFIEADKNTYYSLTDKVQETNGRNAGTITKSSIAVEGAAIAIYGQETGMRMGIIEDVYYDATFNQHFTGMLRFDDYTYGEDGDSGGPALQPFTSTTYGIVGIWKGIDHYGHPVATNWANINRSFGAVVY